MAILVSLDALSRRAEFVVRTDHLGLFAPDGLKKNCSVLDHTDHVIQITNYVRLFQPVISFLGKITFKHRVLEHKHRHKRMPVRSVYKIVMSTTS